MHRIRSCVLALAASLATIPFAWAQDRPPQGGQPVAFESVQPGGASVALRGALYKPEGPAKGAVVLMHGSSGWSDAREGQYGRQFSAAGFTVLAVDSFGPRGIGGTAEDQTKLGVTDQARDAFAARKYLVSVGAAPERLAVMGFSRGAMVALRAADRTWLPSETERFALAIPFYPGCSARVRQPRPAASIFMALGEKDDYTGVKPCQELAANYAAAGGKITVKVYPDASHGFDGNPAYNKAYRLATIENYSDCVVMIEPDGRQSYGGQVLPAEDPGIFDLLRKGCMKKGATMWVNARQKEIATQDVIQFLDANFR